MQRFVPVSQKNYFAKFCANLGSRISISKLLRQKKEKTPGKDRIFSSCPRSVFRCGYHVFFSKILFFMLWILTHLSWLEFQTQYRGYDPSSHCAGLTGHTYVGRVEWSAAYANTMISSNGRSCWGSLCVAHRAKQDGHRLQTHEAASHSAISFDFFFCSRMKDETDKLTVLVLSDRDTGLCLALPTLQKGGKNLSYLVTEMCRFIVHCGHSEVGLRCDGEPSTLALLEAVKRACMGLNIVVHAEPAPTGDHQANGAAESMVGVLRPKAGQLACFSDRRSYWLQGPHFWMHAPSLCMGTHSQRLPAQSFFCETCHDQL